MTTPQTHAHAHAPSARTTTTAATAMTSIKREPSEHVSSSSAPISIPRPSGAPLASASLASASPSATATPPALHHNKPSSSLHRGAALPPPPTHFPASSSSPGTSSTMPPPMMSLTMTLPQSVPPSPHASSSSASSSSASSSSAFANAFASASSSTTTRPSTTQLDPAERDRLKLRRKAEAARASRRRKKDFIRGLHEHRDLLEERLDALRHVRVDSWPTLSSMPATPATTHASPSPPLSSSPPALSALHSPPPPPPSASTTPTAVALDLMRTMLRPSVPDQLLLWLFSQPADFQPANRDTFMQDLGLSTAQATSLDKLNPEFRRTLDQLRDCVARIDTYQRQAVQHEALRRDLVREIEAILGAPVLAALRAASALHVPQSASST